MSNWTWNEKLIEPVHIQIVDKFYDYECGWRFICNAYSDNLNEYLNRNASKTDRRVFVSQFDIVGNE